MSLGVVIKGPEGIVLATDSRVTLTAERPDSPTLAVNFDNATKLLGFEKPHSFVGAVTYGMAVVGLRTAHSYVPEIEAEILEEHTKRLAIREYAEKLSEFFVRQWQSAMPDDYDGPPMVFVIGGFDPGDAYGKVYLFDVPYNPDPVERNPGDTDFGITWGGQLEIASRLIHGFDPALPGILAEELSLEDEQVEGLLAKLRQNLEYSFPYQVLPLQDCVDLAAFLVRTTMDAQKHAVGVRGVGGLIEVAVVTRTEGLQYIRRKEISVND
jgi:hypothetical protein